MAKVMQIAVPSYNRAQIVKDKTLATLLRYNVEPENVTVFVADDDQYKQYKESLEGTPFTNIVVGVPRLPKQRNFIRKYYDEGTEVVQCDDDIDDIIRRVDEKNIEPIKDIYDDVFDVGFKACDDNACNLWGTYAVNNPFFMKEGIGVGLYFCIGVLWGHVIRHDEDLMLTVTEKEDYQRTLQYYVKDGAVARLNNIHAKSVYLKTPGGIKTRTLETNMIAAQTLVDTYPELCTMYIRESTGRAELRLRDSRDKSAIVPSLNLDSFM